MKTSEQVRAFRKWWASKEKEGYQYGPGPLATVAFGFEGGWEAATQAIRAAVNAPKSPGEERRRLAVQRKARRKL
jgi:hypothetical protein